MIKASIWLHVLKILEPIISAPWYNRDVIGFKWSFHGSQVVKCDLKILEKKNFVSGSQEFT